MFLHKNDQIRRTGKLATMVFVFIVPGVQIPDTLLQDIFKDSDSESYA